MRDGFLGDPRRDRKADADAAAGGRENRRVDADNAALEIKGRAARIAAIDRRVDLDKVKILIFTILTADRGNDAAGDRAAKAERVAHRQHPVADPQVNVVGELDIGLIAGRVHLQNGKIRQRIGSDDFRFKLLAVGKTHAHKVSALDNMVVGDDVAVAVDEEAGALRLHAARRVFKPVIRGGLAKAELEKLLQLAGEPAALNLALDQDADDGGADPLHKVSERQGAVRRHGRRHQPRRLCAGGREGAPAQDQRGPERGAGQQH